MLPTTYWQQALYGIYVERCILLCCHLCIHSRFSVCLYLLFPCRCQILWAAFRNEYDRSLSFGLFNRKMVTRYSLDKLLLFSTSTAIIGGVGLFLSAIMDWGGIWGIICFVFIIFSMNGIIASCTNAAALDAVPATMVGSAAAFMGALQYGSGIISSLLLAAFSTGTPFTMAWIMLLFVALSFVAIMSNVKNKKLTVITKSITTK